MKKSWFFMCSGLMAALVLGTPASADNNGHRGQEIMPPNPSYEAACGSCHMPYPPMLLPAASWRSILPDSGEHFGQDLPLSKEELAQARAYTLAHAADVSTAKRARKIMRSLAGETPKRITEIPYIIEKHHEIDKAVFNRPSVGGFANCAACHPGAKQGDFKDDDVKIPN